MLFESYTPAPFLSSHLYALQQTKGHQFMRSEKKKQAPWQSARCFEACFALILTHFSLKMLKTHLCPGRQKCVTAWWTIQYSNSKVHLLIRIKVPRFVPFYTFSRTFKYHLIPPFTCMYRSLKAKNMKADHRCTSASVHQVLRG